MAECEVCGTADGFLFSCPVCGGQYCGDHRDPGAHACGSSSGAPVDGARDADAPDDPGQDSDADPPGASDDERTGVPADRGSDGSPDADRDETEGSAGTEGDDAEAAKVGGLLRRIPVLGRLFG